MSACAAEVLDGSDFELLERRMLSWRSRRTSTPEIVRVVIALGNRAHVGLAAEIADALVEADDQIQVRIAAGFIAGGPEQLQVIPRVCWLGRTTELGQELARADVAVVGGGMTLFEACALGTATVAIPVVDGQRETIAAFVARGAASGIVDGPVDPRAVARLVLELARDARRRSTIARQASQLVSGGDDPRAARTALRLAQAETRH